MEDMNISGSRVRDWVEGYRRAWDSNDPAEIGALFTDDAAYRTEPWRSPWLGRDEIIQGWLGQRDEPGQTSFRWSVLHETPEMAFVQGETDYHDEPPRTYSNLWVIRLDAGGRCSDFTEWWMRHD